MPPRKKTLSQASDPASSQPSQSTQQSASQVPTRRSRRIRSEEPEDLDLSSNPPPASTTRATRSRRTPSVTLSDADESNADTDADQPKPKRTKKGSRTSTKKTGSKATKSGAKKSGKKGATDVSDLDVPETITEEATNDEPAHIGTGSGVEPEEVQPLSEVSDPEDIHHISDTSEAEAAHHIGDDQHLEDVGDQHLEDVGDQHLEVVDDQHLEDVDDQHLEDVDDQHLEDVGDQHLEDVDEQHLEDVGDQHLEDVRAQEPLGTLEPENIQSLTGTPEPEDKPTQSEYSQVYPPSVEDRFLSSSPIKSESLPFSTQAKIPDLSDEDRDVKSESPESVYYDAQTEPTEPMELDPEIKPEEPMEFDPEINPDEPMSDVTETDAAESTIIYRGPDIAEHVRRDQGTNTVEPMRIDQGTNTVEPMRIDQSTNTVEPVRVDQSTNTVDPARVDQSTNTADLPTFPTSPAELEQSRATLKHLAHKMQEESADMPEANLKIMIKRHFSAMATDDIVDLVYELTRYSQERSKTVANLREEAVLLQAETKYNKKRNDDLAKQNTSMSKAKGVAETNLHNERARSDKLGKQIMDLDMRSISQKRKRDESDAQLRALEVEHQRVLQAARTLKPWIKLEVQGDDFKVLGVNSQEAERIRSLLIWGPENNEEQKFMEYLLSTIPVWEHETISNVREAVKTGRFPDKHVGATQRLGPIGRVRSGHGPLSNNRSAVESGRSSRLDTGSLGRTNALGGASGSQAAAIDEPGQHMMSGGMSGVPSTPKPAQALGDDSTKTTRESWSVGKLWSSTVGKFFGSPSAAKEYKTPPRTTPMFEPPQTAPAGKGLRNLKPRRRVFRPLSPQKQFRADQDDAHEILGISKQKHMSSDKMPDLSRFDRYGRESGAPASPAEEQADEGSKWEAPQANDMFAPPASKPPTPLEARRRPARKGKTQATKPIAREDAHAGRPGADPNSITGQVLARVKSELQRGIEDAYDVPPSERWSNQQLGKRKRMVTVRVCDLMEPSAVTSDNSVAPGSFGLGPEEPIWGDDLDDQVEVPEEFAAKFLRPSKRLRLEEPTGPFSFSLDEEWLAKGGEEEPEGGELLTKQELAMMEEAQAYKGNIPDKATDDEDLKQMRAEAREDNYRSEHGITREGWRALKKRYQEHVEKATGAPQALDTAPTASSTIEAGTTPPDNVFGTAEPEGSAASQEPDAAPKTPGGAKMAETGAAGEDSNALARARSQAERYKPKTPSGLRAASRVSTPASALGSPVPPSSAKQVDDATFAMWVEAAEEVVPEKLDRIFGRVGPGYDRTSSLESCMKMEAMVLQAERQPEFSRFGAEVLEYLQAQM